MKELLWLSLVLLACGTAAEKKEKECRMMNHIIQRSQLPCENEGLDHGLMCTPIGQSRVATFPDEDQLEELRFCKKPSVKKFEPQNGRTYFPLPPNKPIQRFEVAIAADYVGHNASDSLERYMYKNMVNLQEAEISDFSQGVTPETLKLIEMLIPHSRYERSKMAVLQAGVAYNPDKTLKRGSEFMDNFEYALKNLPALSKQYRDSILNLLDQCSRMDPKVQDGLLLAKQDNREHVLTPDKLTVRFYDVRCKAEKDGSQNFVRYQVAAVARDLTPEILEKSSQFLRLHPGLEKLTVFLDQTNEKEEGCFLWMCNVNTRLRPFQSLVRELQLKQEMTLMAKTLSKDEVHNLNSWINDYALAFVGHSYIAAMNPRVQRKLREFRAAMEEELPPLVAVGYS